MSAFMSKKHQHTQTPSVDFLPDADLVPESLPRHIQERLSDDLWTLYRALLPTEASVSLMRSLLERLQRMVDREWPASRRFTVHPFGSSVTLLGTRFSDLDVCFIPSAPSSMSQTIVMSEITSMLRRNRVQKIDLRRASARVSVVRFVDPETNISCDINFNNSLALHNTLFVKRYVQMYPLARPLMVLLKFWTLRRLLNNAAAGSLSNYCWTILMLYFLQQRNLVPVIPLSHVAAEVAAWEALSRRTLPPLPTSTLEISSPPPTRINDPALGALFYDFFRFFAFEFDSKNYYAGLRGVETINWDAVAIMVPNSSSPQTALRKTLKFWAKSQLPVNEYRPLCVEDPLNPLRNLSNNATISTIHDLNLEMWRVMYWLLLDPCYYSLYSPGSCSFSRVHNYIQNYIPRYEDDNDLDLTPSDSPLIHRIFYPFASSLFFKPRRRNASQPSSQSSQDFAAEMVPLGTLAPVSL